MARSPRRISAHRRSRSRSREIIRLRTQLNGKGMWTVLCTDVEGRKKKILFKLFDNLIFKLTLE